MVSTQPILHFLQAQTAMQPAGQPACISISPPNSTSTMPQQQLVLVQPQHSQMVLMQQQTVLQDPPGLLPAGLQQQKPRPHLWPLDDQILQQYRTSTLFYAGVLPIATDEGLLGVFEQFGTVVSLEQFKPYKDSKTSKVGGWLACWVGGLLGGKGGCARGWASGWVNESVSAPRGGLAPFPAGSVVQHARLPQPSPGAGWWVVACACLQEMLICSWTQAGVPRRCMTIIPAHPSCNPTARHLLVRAPCSSMT